jgi:hypothetical protein
MQRTLVLLGLMLGLAAAAAGDVRIRESQHVDGYYSGGVAQPARDAENEYWFAGDRLAFRSGLRSYVVDQAAGRFLFINHADKTYIETPLPLDLQRIVPEMLKGYFEQSLRRGTVTPTGTISETGGHPCRGCLLKMTTGYFDVDMTLWLSTDVPFDWRRLGELFNQVRRMVNFGDELIAALGAQEGFALATEFTYFVEGMQIRGNAKVLDWKELEPPPGAYAVPAGYTRKEQLQPQDLGN